MRRKSLRFCGGLRPAESVICDDPKAILGRAVDRLHHGLMNTTRRRFPILF